MKILLINPVARKWALPNCFPSGLGYISSVLKQANHKVDILDLNALRTINSVTLLAADKNYDLIGLTGIITQYGEVKRLAEKLKQLYPETPVVCGGSLATSVPHLLLSKTEIDCCILGEGEKVILDIVNDLDNVREITSVYDSSFQLIKNISTIPWPDYDAFPIEIYINNPLAADNLNKWKDGKWITNSRRSLNMIGSRGCVANCLQGDSLIDIIDENEKCIKKPIKELVGKTPLVLTRDPKTLSAVYARPTRIFKTRENTELIRVHFSDGKKRSYIDCTPDHRFMGLQYKNQFQPRKEWEIEAKDLKPGQSVVACRYPGQLKEHRTLMKRIVGRELKSEEQIHHKNRNHIDNSPSNLQLAKNAKEHFSFHPEISERMKKDNPIFKIPNYQEVLSERAKKTFSGRKKTEEHKQKLSISKIGEKNPNFGKDGPWKGKERTQEVKDKISQKLKGRIITPEWRKNISEGQKGKKFTEEHKQKIRIAVTETKRRNKLQLPMVKNHKVLYIENLPYKEDVYCMELPGYDWFFANDILVHNCLYCYHCYMGQGWRIRSMVDILGEMGMLKDKYDIQYIHFVDDAFACSKKKIMEFCKGKLLSNSANVRWSCAGRANIMDEEMIALMAEAGCIGICFGLESGSQNMLDVMNKKISIKQYERAIALNKRYFTYEDYTFIVGTPGETDQTVNESIEFCKRNNIKPSAVFYMTPYPGTPLFNLLMAYDYEFSNMVNNSDLFEQWVLGLGEQGEKMAWNCSGSSNNKVYEWHQKFIEEMKGV